MDGMLATTIMSYPPWEVAWRCLLLVPLCSPFWVPAGFVGYALGRRRVGMRFLFVLMAAEAIAVVVAQYAYGVLEEM